MVNNDQLIQVGNIASNKNISNPEYKNELDNIIENHYKITDELINDENKDKVYLQLDNFIKKIKEVCLGIFYLKDFSNKNSDLLVSFGEKMSNLIIYYFLKQEINFKRIDLMNSPDYLITDYTYGNANVID